MGGFSAGMDEFDMISLVDQAGGCELEKVQARGLTMLLSVMVFSLGGRFEMWLFQKFLTSLAVRPGSLPAINDHLPPLLNKKTCSN